MNPSPAPNLKYVATLAAVAVVVLVGGALMRPGARSAEQAPPSDTDVRRLANLTERRALESAAAFLGQLADDVGPSLVWLDAPAATGIVWTATTIATTRFEPSLRSLPSVATLEGRATATRVDWSPDLPVTRVEVSELRGGAPATRAEPPTQPGTPLAAVWRTATRRAFAPGSFIELVMTPCGGRPRQEVRTTLAFSDAMAGGGVFDLDGRLPGVILPCGARYAALVPDAVAEVLTAVESFEHRLLARYGLVVEPLTPDELALFDVGSGAMVREVRSRGAAAHSGLRPGDVVVGLDGRPVTRLDDMRGLAGPAPVTSVVFSIQRASKSLDVSVPGGSAAPDTRAGASGIDWQPSPSGFLIAAVQPGSRAAAAGLRAGDRVLRVGQREPRGLEQVRRALDARAGSAVFVEFERDGHRRGIVLAGEAR